MSPCLDLSHAPSYESKLSCLRVRLEIARWPCLAIEQLTLVGQIMFLVFDSRLQVFSSIASRGGLHSNDEGLDEAVAAPLAEVEHLKHHAMQFASFLQDDKERPHIDRSVRSVALRAMCRRPVCSIVYVVHWYHRRARCC